MILMKICLVLGVQVLINIYMVNFTKTSAVIGLWDTFLIGIPFRSNSWFKKVFTGAL